MGNRLTKDYLKSSWSAHPQRQPAVVAPSQRHQLNGEPDRQPLAFAAEPFGPPPRIMMKNKRRPYASVTPFLPAPTFCFEVVANQLILHQPDGTLVRWTLADLLAVEAWGDDIVILRAGWHCDTGYGTYPYRVPRALELMQRLEESLSSLLATEAADVDCDADYASRRRRSEEDFTVAAYERVVGEWCWHSPPGSLDLALALWRKAAPVMSPPGELRADGRRERPISPPNGSAVVRSVACHTLIRCVDSVVSETEPLGNVNKVAGACNSDAPVCSKTEGRSPFCVLRIWGRQQALFEAGLVSFCNLGEPVARCWLLEDSGYLAFHTFDIHNVYNYFRRRKIMPEAPEMSPPMDVVVKKE